jgi:hypothetical protein
MRLELEMSVSKYVSEMRVSVQRLPRSSCNDSLKERIIIESVTELNS